MTARLDIQSHGVTEEQMILLNNNNLEGNRYS
jgi:hypothetical protein